MIKEFTAEYARYRAVGEKAIAQVSDEALNKVIGPDNNSIAMLMRHISGNFISRFTDFLTSDGEKPWRDRDAEFEDTTYSRQEIETLWARGWDTVQSSLSSLSDDQLSLDVYIRGERWSVHGALCRSLAHVAYHVGQMVLLARVLTTDDWKWITIPKGKSAQYNQNPRLEKKPE